MFPLNITLNDINSNQDLNKYSNCPVFLEMNEIIPRIYYLRTETSAHILKT